MSAPLVLLLALIAGVVSDVSSELLRALAIAAVSSVFVAPPPCRRFLAVIALGCSLGAYGASARESALRSPLASALAPVLDDRAAPPVWISGVLREDAVVDEDGARLSIDVDRVRFDDGPGRWLAAGGRAQAGIGGSLAASSATQWVRGRRVTAPMLARRPQIWLNPGASSEQWQRLRRGVDITGSVKSAALVAVEPGSVWSEGSARARALVRRAIDRAVGVTSRESAGIVTAILIGDRTGLDQVTTRRLQAAGTYHVIAISGGNIAIVVGVCLLGLRVFLRSARLIAGLTLAVVLAYGAMVGDQPSVSRAVTAAAVILTLQIVGWCAPALRVLLIAALVVAVREPLAVIDVGAWLSFGAALGIVLLARPISRRLSPRNGRIAAPIIGLLAATIAAELALLPVSAAVFSRVSIAGTLLNFIAIPAMTLAQLAGSLVVLVAPLSSVLASVFGAAAHGGAVALVRSADLIDMLPWLSWQTPPVWSGWTVSYYAGAAIVMRAATSRRLRSAGTAISAASLGVILWGGTWHMSAPPDGFLRISVLDVGQGQSIAVQFPSGHSLLLDAGGSGSSFDVGARVVKPALWALGIRHLDWLVLTHGDLDHAGGAPSVLRDFRPREVWEGIPVPRDAPMQLLRAAAHQQGAVWRRLASGHSLTVGRVLVEVLNPPMADWERPDNRNDDSLVFRLQFGNVGLLLTGDIERSAEEGLTLDQAPRLRLLGTPHHGSRTSSSLGLLRGWLPHAAFVSAGRSNSFGHPAPEVLARYQQLGVEVFRTDLDGAIVIETDGRTVSVETASGRSWRLSHVELKQGG